MDPGESTRLVSCSDLRRYLTDSVLDEVCVTLQNPLTLRIAKLLHEVQLLREEELYKKRSELVSTLKSEFTRFRRYRHRDVGYRRSLYNFFITTERMGALKEAHQGRRELQTKAGLSLEDLEEELAAEWKMMEVGAE